MTDRPILFSAPMVRALLNGTKTQTRRVLKPQPDFHVTSHNQMCDCVIFRNDAHGTRLDTPLPIDPGHRLWVREAWRTISTLDTLKPSSLDAGYSNKVTYEADPENRNPTWHFGKLRPSIFMPRWASRMTLLVTDVRVQRVQEIIDRDALAEGVEGTIAPTAGLDICIDGEYWPDGPRRMFRKLWDGINADRGFGWEANPWIVAYSFEVIKQNIDQIEVAAE